MAATQVEVPALGESVTQAILVAWHKADGDLVNVDEAICELETDKANVDVPAPVAGVVRRLAKEGDTVRVGEAIARIDPDGAPRPAATSAKHAAPAAKPAVTESAPNVPAAVPSPTSAVAPHATALEDLSPAVRTLVIENNVDVSKIAGTGPSGRITREDVQAYLDKSDNGRRATTVAQSVDPTAAPIPQVGSSAPKPAPAADGARRVPISKIRQRIAQRLKSAQNTAAILTTFNEIDMSEVMGLRTKYKERFGEVYGAPLGFMSFFARACATALKELPHVNAEIDGTDIVYHDYVHLGIAVSTERGLAVPVLRNVEKMSFGRIESEIKRLAAATRDGKLGLEELTGGTFTITNGGVFGSLLSTPIINPPQSAILGLHAIQKRPVAVGDEVKIRPMMYTALSYDHRIIDGKEAITFLVRLKQLLEDPARLMLEI